MRHTAGCGGWTTPAALVGDRIVLPRLRPATAELLRRQGVRQHGDLGGVVLYLPRLGGCVRPQRAVGGSWICTFVTTAAPEPVPTGVFLLGELELRAGFAVGNPWLPHAELSAAEFCDVWAIRAAERWPDRPTRFAAALLRIVDVERLEITVDELRAGELMSGGGVRSRCGLQAELARLLRAGFLVDLSADEPLRPGRRFGLQVPALAAARGEPAPR
jgi:hypothetical protein